MQRCWKEVKEERPTFTEIKTDLQTTRLSLNVRQQTSESEDEYLTIE